MAFKFKSSGITNTQKIANDNIIKKVDLPVGIVTPLRYGEKDGLFKMNFSLADQIADNFKNLILTNWGERLGNYYFGANIKELTTEVVNKDNFDEEAMTSIKYAVNKWMPYINVIDYQSYIDHNSGPTGKIVLDISYTISGVQDTPRIVEVVFYII